MIFLILCILCSVIVGVLLKLAKRYTIDIKQAIASNYITAFLLNLIVFKPSFAQFSTVTTHLPLYLSLGVLLPVIFVFYGLAIKKAGLARTDIAQRLSLLISLTAAFFLFNESTDRYKEVGVFIGFVAIIFTMYRKPVQYSRLAWLYLLLVFLGYGSIDVLFKTLSQSSNLSFGASLSFIFGISLVFALACLGYLMWTKKIKIQFINFVFGAFIGIFNYGNILFYIKAHQGLSNNPSVVFAVMNLSVIILGTLIGAVIFRERLNKLNYAGLVMALVAIVLITLSKIHAV